MTPVRQSLAPHLGWAVTLCTPRAPAIAHWAALRCRPYSWARQLLQDGSDPREMSVGAWLKGDIGLILGTRTEGKNFLSCFPVLPPFENDSTGGKNIIPCQSSPQSTPHQTQTPTEAGGGGGACEVGEGGVLPCLL